MDLPLGSSELRVLILLGPWILGAAGPKRTFLCPVLSRCFLTRGVAGGLRVRAVLIEATIILVRFAGMAIVIYGVESEAPS